MVIIIVILFVRSKINKATNENSFFNGIDDDSELQVEEASQPENMPISPGGTTIDALTHPASE